MVHGMTTLEPVQPHRNMGLVCDHTQEREHTLPGSCSIWYDEPMRRRIQDTKIAVGYLRVSTDEQRLGPVAQAAALDAWSEREGVVLAAVFFDHGLSGAKPARKRPGLTAALAAAKELRAGYVVAANRSRIGRSIEVVRAIETEARSFGALLTTADGMSDSTGSTGRLSQGLIDLVHEWERGTIAERVSAALQVKRRRGERVGQVPYGYRLASDGVHLEPQPREQDVLSAVRALRSDGASTRRIVAQLDAWGYVSRAGKPFRQTQVVRMLKPQEGVS